MKHISETLVPILESAFKESINRFESQTQGGVLSDLFLRFDAENDVLVIFDDVENILSEISLERDQQHYSEATDKQLIYTAKYVLQQLEKEHFFDREFIYKPFTVSTIDDDFIVSEELIFIDDDTLKLDGNLLTNMDKELDDFLKELMK